MEAACASGNIMEGSVTIWLPSEWNLGKMRHPWQRTYNDRKARFAVIPNFLECFFYYLKGLKMKLFVGSIFK